MASCPSLVLPNNVAAVRSKAVVLLVLIQYVLLPLNPSHNLFVGALNLCLVLLRSTKCPSKSFHQLDWDDIAGCFILIVFLMPCGC